ncbi:MAG: hypothetical protein Q9163_004307 [Psora crenata]
MDGTINDTELAELAKHLCISEPSDYERQEAAKSPFDERWCEKCFLSFRSKHARLRHIKMCSLHIVCRWCKDPTEYATRQDFRQHRCGDRVSCWLCHPPTPWSNKAALDQHKREAHLVCQACELDVVFLSKEYLRKHKQMMHAAIYCDFCNLLFADRATKGNHMDIEHTRISPDRRDEHIGSVHAPECEDYWINDLPDKDYCERHRPGREERKGWGHWIRKGWRNKTPGLVSKVSEGSKAQNEEHESKEYSDTPKPIRNTVSGLVRKFDEGSEAQNEEHGLNENPDTPKPSHNTAFGPVNQVNEGAKA